MIWLLRHGDAKAEAADDASRELTGKGRRQAQAVGGAMRALGVRLDACLTSPKVRAKDTALIACESLNIEPELTEALRGGDFDPAEVAGVRGEVMLVGHEPDFSRAVALATGGRIKLKKGGLVAIDGPELVLVLRPAELAAIAGL